MLTRAYKSADGFPMVSACRAIPDPAGQGALGVAAIDITLSTLTDIIKGIRIGRTGFVLLVQDDGIVLSDPRNAANNFKKVEEIGASALPSLLSGGATAGEVTIDGKAYQAAVYVSPTLQWKFVGLIEEAELAEPLEAAIGRLAMIVAGSLAFIGLGIWVFTRRTVLVPLQTVAAFLGDVAQGRYEAIRHTRGDEIGSIFDALNVTSSTLKANIAEIQSKSVEAEEKAQACQLATEAAEVAKQQAERAKAEGMLEAARQMEAVAEHIRRAVADLSRHSEDIRQGSQVQRERIHSTATAMEEMNATVLEVAKNAASAASQGTDARDKASQGASVVGNSLEGMRQTQRKTMALRDSMHALDEKARSIGAIMTTIEDIADQTNLLALNAAIEAARAGEAGRGFAVVADEVRKLAEKTMHATQEVGDSIRAIQTVADENVRSVEEAARELDNAAALAGRSGEALGAIVSSADASASQIQSIATAAEEQSATSEEINHSVDEINAIAAQTDNHVQQSMRQLAVLEDQVAALVGLIGQLTQEAGSSRDLAAPAPLPAVRANAMRLS